MNPEIKKQWVDALKSGEYKQGKGMLLSPSDKYCCLGVLCDLHSKVTNTSWQKTDNSYLSQKALLPYQVVQWSGLIHENAPLPMSMAADIKEDIIKKDPTTLHQQWPSVLYLTELNDTTKLTFSDIADLIEKYL